MGQKYRFIRTFQIFWIKTSKNTSYFILEENHEETKKEGMS